MLLTEKKLEELLVPKHVSKDDFDMVAAEAKKKNVPLDLLLTEKGFIQDSTLGRIIADETGCEFLDIKRTQIVEIDSDLLDYIPEAVAYAQKTVALEQDKDTLKVITSNPDNYTFFKLLEKKSGKKVKVFYVTPFNIDQALKRYKGDLRREVKNLLEELEKNPVKKEQNIVELVSLLMEYAYTNLASDIHIEPLSEIVVVRFRIDGIMHKVAEYSKELHNQVVSRIKIMAKLRTDEKAAAQDGRFEMETAVQKIDVRVSILPITEGENVVMRLLMQRGRWFTISDLGLSESDLKKIRNNAVKPYGMILVVGPTGSGKTTTLYAILQYLNKPEVNIMTIEDPVEYNIEGIHQTQLNPAKDITFPKGLRTIVRQDPDVIMIGEIRDEETVDIAINSAMTGHLVLSTMHTNDSATTFPRLLEMGAEPFLVASSVNVAIAQRLVRSICQDCKEEYYLSETELKYFDSEP
ncbi:MAG TPA: type II/IV secretion system protein, partial [Candidatus Pacearchaeota archaeon]|nr:type II/IV secretion system protein [Candidatus Pacearchaeota archaeon]